MKRATFGQGRTPVNRTRIDIAQANRLAAKNEGSSEAILQELVYLLATAVRQNRAVGSES